MLIEYAQKNQLTWIDDPSNDKTHYERNYLRHCVVPALKQRWPSMSKTIARSARVCAETTRLLTEIAQQDVVHCLDSDGGLKLDQLKNLSQARQNNSLRFWLQQQGLSMPSEVQMQQIHQQLCDSRDDAQPKINYHNQELRRYNNKLYCIKKSTTIMMQPIQWDCSQTLNLPENLGQLSAELNNEKGIFIPEQTKVTVRFRQGGEHCHPQGRCGSHPLKKLMQEWQIPPWLRDKVPLIFVDEKLAQVVGYCVCQAFTTKKNQKNYIIKLKKACIH
jgi:tRNA(Ile)-lysidine synthase